MVEEVEMKEKKYTSLMDIVDEAYDMVDRKIDGLRDEVVISSESDMWRRDVLAFLKDLRSLLNLSENFRDD